MIPTREFEDPPFGDLRAWSGKDAYGGGDADIMFGATVEIVRSHLTERAREDLDGAK